MAQYVFLSKQRPHPDSSHEYFLAYLSFKGKRETFLFSGIGRRVFSPFVAHGIFQGTAADIPLFLHLARLKAKKRRERRRTFGTPSSSFSSVRAKRGKNLLPPPPKKINRCSKGVGRGTRFANLFRKHVFRNLVCRSLSTTLQWFSYQRFSSFFRDLLANSPLERF